MDFLRKNGLLFVVFITGAAVLVVEILALRILSPYYGNTIFSASSVISIILAALSLGYYIGGRLADKYPSLKIFFFVILFSGLLIFLLRPFILVVLPNIAHQFSFIWGPFFASIIMFFLPAFLLGTLSPYVIKLQQLLSPQQGIGSISGKVFFWSTLGSILGSLMTGFVLVPKFSIDNIIMVTGMVLILLGLGPLLGMRVKKKIIINSLLILFLVISFSLFLDVFQKEDPSIIYKKEGLYQQITIKDTYWANSPVRLFYQEKNLSSGMHKDSDELLFEYSWYYDVYKIFKPEVKNFMLLGAAAYSIPKEIMNKMPETEIDVVDIEPGLLDLAVEYFDLQPSDKLHDYIDDGRRFLYNSDKKYDYIFGDAFSAYYSMPAHLTTIEFFEIAKEKLTPEGIFVGNFVGSLEPTEESLLISQIKTFKTVFPNSYFLAVKDPNSYKLQNFIFIGYNSDQKIDLTNENNLAKLSPLSNDLDEKLIDLSVYDFNKYIVFTDNYAPVEYLSSLMF